MSDKTISASGGVFFDTNVVVYTYDKSDSRKQEIARSLVEKYITDDRAVVSSQVVQEFTNVGLGRFKTLLSPRDVEDILEEILGPLCSHVPDMDFYLRTLRLHQANSLSFYDALIVQAALDLDCKTLLSEDLQHGQKFGSLVVVNPFS